MHSQGKGETMTTDTVFSASDLKKYFEQRSFTDVIFRREPERIQAVDGVSFDLSKNQTIGIIGESGCGKTTLLKTLIGLHSPTGGDIQFRGESMSDFTKKDWKEYRSNVQIIFQDPFNSLDPKFTVKEVLKEQLNAHNKSYTEEDIIETLEKVELQPGEEYLHQTPDRLSGGEKQRVSIARALAVDPEIILADEPVSMLDVSTQTHLLKLLNRLVDDMGASMIYISHDLSTVSYVCDEIYVMYLGRIVEKASTEEILSNPKHPYTQALIQAVPIPDPTHDRPRTEMDGAPRDPVGLGNGCRFRDRCPERMEVCEKTPDEVEAGDDGKRHMATCHLYYDHEQKYDTATAAVRGDGNG